MNTQQIKPVKLTDTQKQRAGWYTTVPLTFCKCGHSDYIHGDYGKGACEGVQTVHDGYSMLVGCDCARFEAER